MQKEQDNILNLAQYLKKIASSYDSKKSMKEIYDSFKVMSKSYQEFNQKDEVPFNYSNYEYSKCTQEEKSKFENETLELLDCLVVNSIYDRIGFRYTWKDVWNLIQDPIYKNTEKTNRKVVFSCSGVNRPIGDMSWMVWNGIQIIDIDIKDKKISTGLKKLIFNDLKKYHWFLGCALSASGKSLHVWTKITPITIERESRKIEYLCNFRHKYSYIYITLVRYMSKFGYTKEDIFDYMDMAMAKPQQGIFITSDIDAMMNTNFQDLRLDANFESALKNGIESINWISHPDLKRIFTKLEWFNNDNFNDSENVQLDAISNLTEWNQDKVSPKHYKHAQRWQLANTLTSLYGYDKALQVMSKICRGTDYKELKGDVKTASIHNKPISVWAVRELNNKHGFNIKINNAEDLYKEEQEKFNQEDMDVELSDKAPTGILGNEDKQVINLHLNNNQYLSDIKNDILNNLGHITLLEAGAGYGKTEMIKAFKSKTLLVLPFTSTIKAKVEKSETTSDWLYYYGNKRPTLDDLVSDKSMAMTMDKFSNLNVMEVDASGFEYIVIDESHLLFTSSYREVMSPIIQRLANCKSKIIMMTGTPTGEMLFFPGIKHIRAAKDDNRIKEMDIHMCPTDKECLFEMCKMMANDIISGRKILFPSNRGNLYFEEITGLIQSIMNEQGIDKQVNAFYYKKSNYGDDTMESINIEKSIGNNDLIMCTTYLSVGVDICDKYEFGVYFNEQWIPQDIEQFANRLRGNDLHIKMFLPKMDNMGIPFNYFNTKPLDLSFEEKDLLLAHDLIRTCNDMLDRNQEESKYNPLISSLLTANKYLKYDENDCKYYIDETTYKLKIFEDRYGEYSKQLNIMTNGLKYYGYTVAIVDHKEQIPEDKYAAIEQYLKSCKSARYNYVTNQTMEFLNHVTDNNIDIYKDLLRGDYDIFKSDSFKTVREENDLYTTDIEILERNVPIVVAFYKDYDCDTIKDIYQYCIEKKQNRINYSKLNRIQKFVTIERNRKKKRLDFPVLKFIKDAQKFATANFKCEITDVTQFQKDYAAKYANSVKDVVVDDIEYLEKIYAYIQDLWKVIIEQSRPKNGIVSLKPFEMLWDTKQSIIDLYNDTATKQFFLQELVENMKEDDVEDEEEQELPELPHTSKYKLSQIESKIKNTIHPGYSFGEYSLLDGSNERFIRKMVNTNKMSNNLFSKTSDDISYMSTVQKEKTLFDECPF